jgi:hypothetical protein
MRMLRSITSQMPSYIRAEPNMVTSRWIQGMISPPAVTAEEYWETQKLKI